MNSRAGGAKDAEEEVFFPGRKAFLTWRDFAVSARGKEKKNFLAQRAQRTLRGEVVFPGGKEERLGDAHAFLPQRVLTISARGRKEKEILTRRAQG